MVTLYKYRIGNAHDLSILYSKQSMARCTEQLLHVEVLFKFKFVYKMAVNFKFHLSKTNLVPEEVEGVGTG